MKFFGWFREGSNKAGEWELEREEREYIRKKEKEVRRAKLDDLKRYNQERKLRK